MKKLEIQIPEGKEIDWEASAKQKQIVFKDKQLTYADVCINLFDIEHHFIGSDGNIYCSDSPAVMCLTNATTRHQLECILAKNQLANVARYLNGDWNVYETSKTKEGHFNAYILWLIPTKSYIGCSKITICSENSNVLFKSKELAQQAIEILGEETVKLALEPLY